MTGSHSDINRSSPGNVVPTESARRAESRRFDTPQIGRFVVCKVGQKWDTRKVKKESPQSAVECTLGAL